MPSKQPKITDMYTEVMEITPAQAAEFLRLNAANRPVRQSWVRTLEGIIERGEWQITHQGIAITKDNCLLDGQHRLQAIVNTGATVHMAVSFDCDPRTFQVVDSGIKRTTGDHLRISPNKVAVAKLVWKLSKPYDRAAPSSAQVADVLTWAADPIDEVLNVAASRSQFSSSGILVALAVHVMAGRNEVLEKLRAFVAMDFDHLTPSLKSFTKQIVDKNTSPKKAAWDLTARAWRAFDPAAWEVTKVQVKDTDVALAAMQRVAETYRKRAIKLAKVA